MRKWLMGWIVTALWAWAQTPSTLALDDLIVLALRHSPDLQRARLEVNASRTRIETAKSLYRPRIDALAGAGSQSARLKHRKRDTIALLSGTLQASQLLYDFGKTEGAIDSAEAEVAASRAELRQLLSDKILQIKTLYYEILKAKGDVAVQRKNVELSRAQLYRAKRYLQQGIRSRIDLSDAKVRLAKARRDLEDARFRVDLLRSRLEQALGIVPENGEYRLFTPSLKNRGFSDELPPIPASLHLLEREALSRRPSLESYTHRIESAKGRIKSATADYYPRIDLQGSATAQHVDESVATSLPQTESRLLLNARWNLFSGYATDAQAQEARIRMLQNVTRRTEGELAVQQEVDAAYIALRQSHTDVHLNTELVEAAEIKWRQAQKRYENGLGDYLEVRYAQRDYIDALKRLNNSYYDVYISQARLEHAIGR